MTKITGVRRKVRVLIVEDNPADAMLIEMALEAGGLDVESQVAPDGDVAVARLCTAGEEDRPDLVILDLNLPKRHGIEVLREIRSDRCRCTATVIVLSSSPEDVIEELVHAARVEADGYLTKPLTLDEFLGLGAVIRQFYEGSAAGRRTR